MAQAAIQKAFENARTFLLNTFDQLQKTEYRPDLIAETDATNAVEEYVTEWINMAAQTGIATNVICEIVGELKLSPDFTRPLSELVAAGLLINGHVNRRGIEAARSAIFHLSPAVTVAFTSGDTKAGKRQRRTDSEYLQGMKRFFTEFKSISPPTFEDLAKYLKCGLDSIWRQNRNNPKFRPQWNQLIRRCNIPANESPKSRQRSDRTSRDRATQDKNDDTE